MSFFINKPSTSNLNDSFNIHTQTFTATEGQTLFTLSDTYQTGLNRIKVNIEGVPQYSPTNFAETSSTSFTLTEGVSAGTKVVVELFQ
jgi:hypothetical protein